MERRSVRRDEADIHRDLGLADFGVHAGCVVRTADGVPDGAEGAGWPGTQRIDPRDSAGGDAGNFGYGSLRDDGAAMAWRRDCGTVFLDARIGLWVLVFHQALPLL